MNFFIFLAVMVILYLTGCFNVLVRTRITADDDGQSFQVTERVIRLKGPFNWHVATFMGRKKLDLNSVTSGNKDLIADKD